METEGKLSHFILMSICLATFHLVKDPLAYAGAYHIPEGFWSCHYGLSWVSLAGSCSHRDVVQLHSCAEGASALLFSRIPTIFTHRE